MIDIKTEGLSKKYCIYSKPKDIIKEYLSFGRKKYHYECWALKDINLEVKRGTTIGVVGANGSGKSTLLKIISGISTPTEGTVETRGRISALIELGMGFHPEFTGRENVYMNAALLGISRDEINKRFDDILDFSELHNFIDFPIKIYSSGMQVRLAFSVAIYTSPDILIIDEALAVGDARFQYRCINKIKEFQDRGITIFFVSHDPGAVKMLCKKAILLDDGMLVKMGETGYIMDIYNKLITQKETQSDKHKAHGMDAELEKATENKQEGIRHGSFEAKVSNIELFDDKKNKRSVFCTGALMKIEVELEVFEPVNDLTVGMVIKNRYGMEIYGTNTYHQGQYYEKLNKGERMIVAFTQKISLMPDDYFITVALHLGGIHLAKCFDWWDNAASFKVLPSALPFSGIIDLNSEINTRRA
tara:strand:- start:7997 stop:9247 length:1251 start_codon:yes stop_codon:yes gene_type:complete